MSESPNTTAIAGSRLRSWQNAGAPTSGTSGTLAGIIAAGALLWDTDNGVQYVNEGSILSPYYTPVGYDQAALFGVHSDWRDRVGMPVADTSGEIFLVGSGVRITGQGSTEVDSGFVIQIAGEGGTLARMTTTDEVAHTVAIGMATDVMQPDQHQLMVVDVEFTNISAITARAMFGGFIGVADKALDPVVTGATTVATLVADDLAGLWFDTGLDDGDRIFGVSNKANDDATQDLAVEGNTSVNVAAAATFQRWRVEINAAGDMLGFLDKIQVYALAGALGVAQEISPVFYLEAQATAVKSADVRRFATWAYR